MFRYKNKNSFKNRVKFDKPIIKKNSDDFDDLDIDSDFSFDDSNKSDLDRENSSEKTKSSTLKNKGNKYKKEIKNKVNFKFYWHFKKIK